METAIIIVLAFMLLIALIILIDISFNIKRSNIRIQVSDSLLDKLKKENEKLKNKNADFRNQIDEQERKFKEYKKYSSDSRDLKITELETKYQSALQKIIERDQKTRLLDSEILKYEKCNKQIAEELIKKNNVIEDSYTRIKNMDQEKQFAINQSKSAMKLCNEMANKFESLNSELESIQLQLKLKVKKS